MNVSSYGKVSLLTIQRLGRMVAPVVKNTASWDADPPKHPGLFCPDASLQEVFGHSVVVVLALASGDADRLRFVNWAVSIC